MTIGLDDASLGFWIWDVDNGIELYSPKFRASIGYSGEKDFPSVPKSWMDALSAEDLKMVLENFDRHVNTRGEHPYVQKVTYNKKYGGTVDLVCHGKVLLWEDDKPKLMLGVHIIE